jgi:hypothetical protein
MRLVAVVLIVGAVPLVSMFLAPLPEPIGNIAGWVFLVSFPTWLATIAIFVLTEVVPGFVWLLRKRTAK